MRLKFYRIQNQPEKILGELQKIFNVKDSNTQERNSLQAIIHSIDYTV